MSRPYKTTSPSAGGQSHAGPAAPPVRPAPDRSVRPDPPLPGEDLPDRIVLPDRADALERIANALERLAPAPPPTPDLAVADAFIWHPDAHRLAAVQRVNRVDMALLKGI